MEKTQFQKSILEAHAPILHDAAHETNLSSAIVLHSVEHREHFPCRAKEQKRHGAAVVALSRVNVRWISSDSAQQPGFVAAARSATALGPLVHRVSRHLPSTVDVRVLQRRETGTPVGASFDSVPVAVEGTAPWYGRDGSGRRRAEKRERRDVSEVAAQETRRLRGPGAARRGRRGVPPRSAARGAPSAREESERDELHFGNERADQGKSGSAHLHVPHEPFAHLLSGRAARRVPTARDEPGQSAGHVGARVRHAGIGRDLSPAGATLSADAAPRTVPEHDARHVGRSCLSTTSFELRRVRLPIQRKQHYT